MSKYKIGVWGQFGDGGKIADGQAVRTTIITEELKNRYGSKNILVINTNNWKKHPVSFLLNTVKLTALCEKVVIFPADNGFKIGVPIFHLLNFLFKKQLYDVVIGGYLPDLLKRKPVYLNMLKKYKALFVQTNNLKSDLENLGLNNIHILSNLKRLKTIKPEEIFVNTDDHIKVCTLSRVTQTKGIGYAIDAVRKVNSVLGAKYVHLDVYGIIAPEYEENFQKLLKENADIVSYGGVLDYDKTTQTLKSYFAMLFPTYYYGEGFPGNVIDAYNAGLPIIATDWLYIKDVVINDKNGILVPIKNTDALSEALLNLYNNREKARGFALNNIESAENYTPDKVLTEFYEYMDV